ncbi:nucleotide-binding alpha-beta plait domain-containing protein [Tanacetum coccineum]
MPTSRLKNSTTMMKMANGGRLQEDATSPKSLLEDPNCLILISRYGKVVDVYIAFKRTKKGSRFGFVRFMNVGDVTEFEKRLKNIMIGDVAMVINSVKFSKVGGMGIPPFEFPPISHLASLDQNWSVVGLEKPKTYMFSKMPGTSWQIMA